MPQIQLPEHRQGRRLALQAFIAGFVLAFFAFAPAFWGYQGRYIIRGDYIEQQIPFLIETRRLLLSGSPFWSWNTLFGASFLGNYAFYTAGSPFVWILLPVPESLLPHAITVVSMLKQAVATWAAFLYSRRFVSNPRYAQLGGLLYAFSGFMLINAQFYHFADIIAVFPLVLAALEDSFSAKPHHGALALACTLNVLVNYYFFLGTAIFVAIYTVFRVCSSDLRSKYTMKRLPWSVLECGLGCLMAAVLLFPAAWAMFGISRTGRFMMFDFNAHYSIWDILERLRVLFMPIESSNAHAYYPSAADWASVGAFLPLFGMTGVLFSIRKRPVRWTHLLLLLLVLISLIMPLNRLFVLGSNNTYTRWWYALVLMLCLATIQALDQYQPSLQGDQTKMAQALLFSLLCTMLMVVPFLLPTDVLTQLQMRGGWLERLATSILSQRVAEGESSYLLRWFSIGAWAVNLLCCYAALSPALFPRKRVLLALTGLCIVVNSAGFLYLNNQHHSSGGNVGHVTNLDYYVYHELDQEKPVHEGTTYTYRIDYPPKILNYGMLVNQPSISNFHSIRSSYLTDFLYLNGFGFNELPYAYPPDQEDGAIRTLMGVKYYYNYDEEYYPGAPEGFVLVDRVGEVNIYENQNSLPIGFAYTHFAVDYYTPIVPETLSALMLNAAVLDYKTEAPFKDWVPVLHQEEVLPWQDAAAERAAMACYDVEMTPNGLTAKIDLDEQRIVGFSVPYDKGWSATLNEEPAEVYSINMGLTGLIVPAGEAVEIELVYRPRGLWQGAVVSVVSLIVWVIYCYWRRRRSF